MKKVGIYCRVSTQDQTTDSQLLDLRRYAADRGWEVYREFCDNGVSGSVDNRPALNDLMNDAKKRRFDSVLVWRFDRFARSTTHLLLALDQFRNLGIDFVSFQENIDTSSPLGSAIFTIISAVAQLEKDIIAERVKAGLRKAKSQGTKLGRPRVIVDADRIAALRAKGWSWSKITTELDIGKGTAQRAFYALAQKPQGI